MLIVDDNAVVIIARSAMFWLVTKVAMMATAVEAENPIIPAIKCSDLISKLVFIITIGRIVLIDEFKLNVEMMCFPDRVLYRAAHIHTN